MRCSSTASETLSPGYTLSGSHVPHHVHGLGLSFLWYSRINRYADFPQVVQHGPHMTSSFTACLSAQQDGQLELTEVVMYG